MFFNLSLRPEYSQVKIKENQIKVWKLANVMYCGKEITFNNCDLQNFEHDLNHHNIDEGTCDACVTVYLHFSFKKNTLYSTLRLVRFIYVFQKVS